MAANFIFKPMKNKAISGNLKWLCWWLLVGFECCYGALWLKTITQLFFVLTKDCEALVSKLANTNLSASYRAVSTIHLFPLEILCSIQCNDLPCMHFLFFLFSFCNFVIIPDCNWSALPRSHARSNRKLGELLLKMWHKSFRYSLSKLN